MPDAEEVVEAIQANAAAEVAVVAAAGDSVLSEQVAEVSDDLADHAEVSEERHEEILEGESWQRESMERLTASMGNIQTQLSNLQASIVSLQASLLPPIPSPVLTPLIPEPSVETLIVVEPESAAEEGQKEAEQSKPVPPKKRRRRLI